MLEAVVLDVRRTPGLLRTLSIGEAMRIENTSAIPTSKLREIITFTRPPGIKGQISFAVTRHRGRYRGRAWGMRRHILMRFNERAKLPITFHPVKGYLKHTEYTLDEAIVHLAAHEQRHVWQIQHRRGYRVWGARGVYSERDADAYAIRMVRAWRRRSDVPAPSLAERYGKWMRQSAACTGG
jgi:hypothetical protein